MKCKSSMLSAVLFYCFVSLCTGQVSAEKADHLFYAHQQKDGPGLAIRVTKDNHLLYKNQVGSANLEHQISISDSTVFLVGSISKQFTVYSILLLEQEGKLSLDDPITKYLPELNQLNKTITIRMLANHTNGFRNTFDLNGLRGRSDQDLIGQDEMVALLLRQEGLNFEPGKRFQYNNAGYVLLAEIVERVAKIPFSSFTEQNIFKPLKMHNSLFLENPTTTVKNKADSYSKDENGYSYVPMNRSIVGSTGLYTTTEDLTKWTQNYISPKTGSPVLFDKMIAASKLNSGEEIPYGLGLETKMYRGLKVVFHGGGDAAYRAYLLYLPKYDFTVAITGNYESFNPLDLAYGMIDIFLADHLTEQDKPSEAPLIVQNMDKYEGTYQVFPGLYINILRTNDSLFFQSYTHPEEKLYLPSLTDHSFEFTASPHSRIVFSNNQLVWHFSDFAYPAEKVILNPPSYDQISIQEYLGKFYNHELPTSYTFLKKKNKIIAQHAFNEEVELIPIDQDAFITTSGILSRIEFIRNDQNTIVACKISGQTAYNIRFVKQHQ